MKPENLWINVDGEEVQYDISKGNRTATITLNVDPDQIDLWVAEDLRRCYVDAKTLWHHDVKYNERICDALLTVIEHYMPHAEFEAWYETIKEL